MNILILQGSPRANGNTAWMAKEYRKAAESAGRRSALPCDSVKWNLGKLKVLSRN